MKSFVLKYIAKPAGLIFSLTLCLCAIASGFLFAVLAWNCGLVGGFFVAIPGLFVTGGIAQAADSCWEAIEKATAPPKTAQAPQSPAA